MNKLCDYLRNNIWLFYMFLFGVVTIWHMVVQIGTADDVWFLEHSKMGLIEFTKWRVEEWTSRNIIEIVMLVLLNMNKYMWVILDSSMFVLILHSMRKIVRPTKENNLIVTILIVLVILLFPISYFSQAGWYATTLNYVWPLALGLYGLSYIMRFIDGEPINFIQKIMIIISTVYATNQEQMSALFVGFYGLFIIYALMKRKQVPTLVYIILFISILMLVYHAVCPGNAVRKLVETNTYFPEFDKFSLIDKITMGVVTTISTSLVSAPYIIYVWNIALLYIVYKNSNNMKQKVFIIGLTIINFIISISDKFSTYYGFKYIFGIFGKFIYYMDSIDYSDLSLYLVILYFIINIVVFLYVIRKNLDNKMFLLIGILLGAAFCSRVILGLSASIFVSGTRTFINTYFMIFISSILCFNSRKIKTMI